jgi:hypothetical protein
MEYASSKLELDCWTARYIFCRQAEVGFSLELDLTRSLGHSQILAERGILAPHFFNYAKKGNVFQLVMPLLVFVL